MKFSIQRFVSGGKFAMLTCDMVLGFGQATDDFRPTTRARVPAPHRTLVVQIRRVGRMSDPRNSFSQIY